MIARSKMILMTLIIVIAGDVDKNDRRLHYVESTANVEGRSYQEPKITKPSN